MESDFVSLKTKIISCTRCPRLVHFREHAPLRKISEDEKPWRRPVPGFGDKKAWLLILGLAPSLQGANRTGRCFTGDESAKFLIKSLYLKGMASQPYSEKKNDGLRLIGCYLTAAVKCVPPKHHPTKQEFLNCSDYLANELYLLKSVKAVLALGKLAFESYLDFLYKNGSECTRQKFEHGQTVKSSGWPTLYGSYHPSPQNTYTGRLTNEMLISLLTLIKEECQK
jgi:uracil-DNA glycosylase